MPNIALEVSLFPMRISLRERQPQELTIKITNNDAQAKALDFELLLPPEVGLDKGGLNRGVKKRLAALRPNETIKMDYNVFVSKMAGPGNYEGRAVLAECSPNFEYTSHSYKKELLFRVTD
ncbi:MAG: hypothetical protein V1494_07090 [Candidatus Diapherotrites archaeon]